MCWLHYSIEQCKKNGNQDNTYSLIISKVTNITPFIKRICVYVSYKWQNRLCVWIEVSIDVALKWLLMPNTTFEIPPDRGKCIHEFILSLDLSTFLRIDLQTPVVHTFHLYINYDKKMYVSKHTWHYMLVRIFEWLSIIITVILWFEYCFNILIDSTDDRLGLAIFRTAFTTSILYEKLIDF